MPPDPAALVAAIRAECPALHLRTDPAARKEARADETRYLTGGLPAAIAFPTSTADVVALVRLAGAHGVAIVPRGAGSGLSGGANGIDGALTIDLTRMDRIVEIDAANLVAVVEPGVINARLRAAALEHGLFYAPDPASTELSTIGGNIGTNAGGLCCVRYGQTRDSVLGLEVVLADGSVIRTGGKNVKDVAGYGLTGLFVGSQGTLGIVTQATLRLRPAPPPRGTLLAFFPMLDAAGDAVAAVMREGVDPVVLELLDGPTIVAVEDWQHLGLDRDAAAMLMIESDLPGAAAADALALAERLCTEAGATSTVRSLDPVEADLLRAARRLAARALERIGDWYAEDIAVPRSQLPALLRAIAEITTRHGVRCATFGHAGDGNLHPNLIFERGDPRAGELADAVRVDLYAAALALGGSVTAEHGIGTARRGALVQQVGADAVAVMRRIKDALDPAGLLNPGKVL